MKPTPSPNAAESRESALESHLDAARRAHAHAQSNPIMSIDQLFAVARIHALLAIEAQLTHVVAELGRQG